MPHQWMEGNLPVSAKCAVCDKNCGSVLRLQDWRCLWCRAMVHTQCRPSLAPACPLGVARVSVVPPTALHSIQDEAWEAVRPQASSPLLVFVNSKSGDNQGVKFLRRFKQLLNPAQVFDLILTGPRLGLRLFRHFDPFRILVCSGDGSVGWVLSEIDKLDMHKQCQVAVLPLGTGNDLARVLGWGASCDDDTHLPQLLEKYERASTKILDRWSVMAFERTVAMPKLSLTPGQPDGLLHTQIAQYEETLVALLHNILQSDETSIIISSAKRLCDTVKDLVAQVASGTLTQHDNALGQKCDALQTKLDHLVQTLTNDHQSDCNATGIVAGAFHGDLFDEDEVAGKPTTAATTKEDTESEMSYEKRSEKSEKELSNINFRKHRRTSRFVEKEKNTLISRADSLKRAIKNLVEHTEQVVEEKNRHDAELAAAAAAAAAAEATVDNDGKAMDSLKVLPTIIDRAESMSDVSSCASQSSTLTARLVNISPMPDIRRDSSAVDDAELINLPVPPDFADSRRASQIQQNVANEQQLTEQLLISTCASLMHKRGAKEVSDSPEDCRNYDEDKECTSILSVLSNEEASLASEIAALDQHSFCPQKDSDGEDVNGHIGHIDSPETDTAPNSDALAGESLLDDLSSMLGNEYGFDLDSIDTTEEVAATTSSMDVDHRRRSLKFDSIERKRKASRASIKSNDSAPSTQPPPPPPQFGFENPAFMSQHVYLDKVTISETQEQVRYCSLAQFVEGSDIARCSFKRRGSKSKAASSKCDANAMRPSTLAEESCESSSRASRTSLNKLEAELLEDGGNKEAEKFPQVSVVVEPPSPDRGGVSASLTVPLVTIAPAEACDMRKLAAAAGSDASNASSNSNLLGIDNEHFLLRSPAATRRISCCSMINPTDSAALMAAAAATSKFYAGGECANDKREQRDEKSHRRLPIINPLVRLPTFPNVGTGTGFIGKCLLANADTLCAAVSPLIDPDDALLEGFFERCVMNNYFGIGIDAKISLDFHHKREEHPEKCRSRAKNYMWYGVLGSKQLLQKTYKNLEQRVQLECDGHPIPLPHLQGIVILNIPSFMGGTNFWGGTKQGDIFLAPSFDDKILEVMAVFGSVQMAASRLINLQHHRIAQCQSIQINILGDEGVPIQVDGEAWIQPPGIIRILHKNRMQMLCRNRALENSLRAWEEKQRASIAAQGGKHRASVPHDKARTSLTRQSIPSHAKPSFLGVHLEYNKLRQHSFSGPVSISGHPHPPQVTFLERPPTSSTSSAPETLFSDEEHHMLLVFIECATGLVKWIKILAISYALEVDLYALATVAERCLEGIHPGGKLLTGAALRREFTALAHAVRVLYAESCTLLHDRGDKLTLREDLENKLSAALASMEMELRRCVTSSSDGLMYLHTHDLEQAELPKRKGPFWMKFRKASNAHLFVHAPQKSSAKTRDVATWGAHEVGTWLETLQLTEYVESFERNDIRGRELLTLARRDLKELGVTKVGHVKRILQAIKDLNQGIN